MKLENKVAVITGGSRGIGRATSELFIKEGAKVILWDVLESGKTTAQEIGATFMQVNVADFEQVSLSAQKIVQDFGQIDILINNAGILRDATLLKLSPQHWQDVIDINLTGVFNCTKAIAPFMTEKKYGRIVSASSIVGIHGNFGQTNYVAAKAGIIGMTKVWAKELGKFGITVNAVAPGFIETDMTDSIPDDYKKMMIDQIPLKRAGKAQDIAQAYLFLASSEASFISGHCLSVNGGAG